jgi:hypothetical protein
LTEIDQNFGVSFSSETSAEQLTVVFMQEDMHINIADVKN